MSRDTLSEKYADLLEEASEEEFTRAERVTDDIVIALVTAVTVEDVRTNWPLDLDEKFQDLVYETLSDEELVREALLS